MQEGEGCALVVTDKIITQRALQSVLASVTQWPQGWPRLRTLTGSVTEKEALARGLADGACHLGVTSAEIGCGIKFARVPVLVFIGALPFVPGTPGADQLLRQLKPGRVRTVQWEDFSTF